MPLDLNRSPDAKSAVRPARDVVNPRKVPQIVFKADWAKHAEAPPLKRNDQLLGVLPAGLIAFPGTGISANLADKAKRRGPTVQHFAEAPTKRCFLFRTTFRNLAVRFPVAGIVRQLSR
jgi:hypothetical protein